MKVISNKDDHYDQYDGGATYEVENKGAYQVFRLFSCSITYLVMIWILFLSPETFEFLDTRFVPRLNLEQKNIDDSEEVYRLN